MKLSQILKWDLPATQDQTFDTNPRVKVLRLIALSNTGDLMFVDVNILNTSATIIPITIST